MGCGCKNKGKYGETLNCCSRGFSDIRVNENIFFSILVTSVGGRDALMWQLCAYCSPWWRFIDKTNGKKIFGGYFGFNNLFQKVPD